MSPDHSRKVKSRKNLVLLFKIEVSRKYTSFTFRFANAGLGLDLGRVLCYFWNTFGIEGRSRRTIWSYLGSNLHPAGRKWFRKAKAERPGQSNLADLCDLGIECKKNVEFELSDRGGVGWYPVI